MRRNKPHTQKERRTQTKKSRASSRGVLLPKIRTINKSKRGRSQIGNTNRSQIRKESLKGSQIRRGVKGYGFYESQIYADSKSRNYDSKVYPESKSRHFRKEDVSVNLDLNDVQKTFQKKSQFVSKKKNSSRFVEVFTRIRPFLKFEFRDKHQGKV